MDKILCTIDTRPRIHSTMDQHAFVKTTWTLTYQYYPGGIYYKFFGGVGGLDKSLLILFLHSYIHTHTTIIIIIKLILNPIGLCTYTILTHSNIRGWREEDVWKWQHAPILLFIIELWGVS